MPRKFIDPKKATHFQLVHKPHDDPSYEDSKTAGVLVKTERVGNRRTKGWDESAILDETMKMDMHNPDDTAEPGLFDDEVEEEFDQDWIREMMAAPEGESDDEEEPDEYPRHEARRDIDHEFDALMRQEYAAHQMDMEEDDPRADGPLPVEAYVPALRELVDRQRQDHFSIAPTRERGHFMEGLAATGEEVFHEDQKGGKFLTVLRSKKDIDIEENWSEEEEEAREFAVRRLRRERELLAEQGREDEDIDAVAREKFEYIRVRQKPTDKWDCQTQLTTMSTLENRPQVIAVESKRIRLKRGVPVRTAQNRLTARALQRLGEEGAAPADTGDVDSQLRDLQCVQRTGALSEEEYSEARDKILRRAAGSRSDGEEGEDDEDVMGGDEESMITVYDTAAGRPKGEDKDQKRARKKAVREEARMKREAKKQLRTAYKAETIRARYLDPKAKQQKAQITLS
eukprot:TRINITY_DN7923_c0_g1_i1.p2 TRINITY_DN7923_c0_g1~~TRINITY_DN7923_c0_g1_i1.p2  ORF type:complete len:456 (+),score=200.83 TRINITY_DN7923_c0_g1_i1:64-1431(+)